MATQTTVLRPAALAVAVVSALVGTAAVAQQVQQQPTQSPQLITQHQLDKRDKSATKMVRDYAVTRFIVELEDPAAAVYKGGLAGFAPTSPKATGAAQLQLNSTPVTSYQQHLLGKQNEVARGLRARVGNLEVKHHLTLTFNGLVVEVPEQVSDEAALRAHLAQVPGVKRVYEDKKYYANTATSMDLINAPAVWSALGGQAQAGRDVKIAIIDSGIDPEHPMFADNGHPTVPRPSKADYCTTNISFCNDKIIVARWYEPQGEVDAKETESPLDINGHGTHVAGIASGNPATVTFDGASLNLTGVAPGAHLMVYKALFDGPQDSPASGSSSQLLPALEDAVADGADVINNSWGSGPGGDPADSPYRDAFAAAREAGVLTVTAAGNAGPGDRTIACPGCIEDGLTVSSSQHGGDVKSIIETGAFSEIYAKPGSGNFTINEPITALLALAANSGDNLACSSFASGTFNQQIVVVQRGSCNFSTKANNIQAAGGLAMIVYNNEPGIVRMSMGEATLPSVSITQPDGQAIIADWQNGDTATINIPQRYVTDNLADTMSDFSGRGPNGNSTFLKPDLTAPGSDIIAPYLNSSYVELDGTSMASPHVAGAAALVLDTRPNLTAEQLKSILMTSSDSGLRDDDLISATTPFDRGAGRLNLEAAQATQVVVDTPSLANNACSLGCDFTRNFTNIGNAAVSFSIETSFNDPNISAVVDQGLLALNAGESGSLTFSIDTRFAAEGWHFGEVLLTSSPHPTLRLPVAVYASSSDNEAIVTAAHTSGEVAIDAPIGVQAKGALGSGETPVTLSVTLPDGAILDESSVIVDETLSQRTSLTISAGEIVWQGSQNDEPDIQEIGLRNGLFFAGKTVAQLTGNQIDNPVCTEYCDDEVFSLPIENLGGIYLDGVQYNNLVISANGIIGAGSIGNDFADSASNQAIPDESPPNAFWAPFWSDLEIGLDAGGGQLNIAAVKVNDTNWLAIEFENVREYDDDSGDRYTFSLWAELGTDNVYFNYIDLPAGAPANLTIGAEAAADALGVIGAQYYFDGLGTYPANADVLLAQVERGARASVVIDFTMQVDTIADAPDRVVTTGRDEPATIDLSTAFAEAGRDLLTLVNVSDANRSYDAVLPQVIEADGAVLAEIVSEPGNGTVVVTSNNNLTYTPASGFVGDDSFTYRGVDSAGQMTTVGTVEISVINNPPQAVVEEVEGPQEADTTLELDASGSSDPDGDTLSFSWTQVSGTSAAIADADQAIASIVVPAVDSTETAVFEVTVSDGTDSDTAQVQVIFQGPNRAPNASANSALRRVPSGQAVTLSGSSSGDPDGDVLSYNWEQVSGPAVELSSPEGETTQFNAPSVSTEQDLVFRLTVSDGELSDTDEVTITVYPREEDAGEESSGSFGAWLALLGLPLIWLRRRTQR
ncbi:S8 family serine peptidase [Pseudidiomarina insulisalsae]|uniref:Peptidase S8 n=1 Tax=Pseudidiomarina insulisalsae TaxID=575789 RepID=A0A432YLK2_9GAMM|nr:S8 family serine peptidase [Pseudidiomarina insulisalsae]RUO61820.1 hypothetical protein CWI71_05520 [Pseudidiomarina insulisalsae]